MPDKTAALDDSIEITPDTFDLLAGWTVTCTKCMWISGFIQWRSAADEVAGFHQKSAAHNA